MRKGLTQKQETNSVSLERAKYKRGQHPNSRKNLQMFPKGSNGDHSHNGYTLTSALKDSLHKPLRRPDLDAPVRDHIIYATLKGAIACEPTSAHLKEVWDRSEGKLIDKQAFLGDILIEVVYRNKKEIDV